MQGHVKWWQQPHRQKQLAARVSQVTKEGKSTLSNGRNMCIATPQLSDIWHTRPSP